MTRELVGGFLQGLGVSVYAPGMPMKPMTFAHMVGVRAGQGAGMLLKNPQAVIGALETARELIMR